MPPIRPRSLATAAVVATALMTLPHVLAATPPSSPGAAPADSSTTTTILPAPAVTEKDFNVKNFSAASTTIDNPFLPLTPGVATTLIGTATRGTAGEHKVVFTVTDVTKVINGVNAVAVWDRDFQNGALVEEELAFMAQDDQGNVWSMGEYPEEHDAGTIATPSVWLAGNQQAIAGLLMRANPQLDPTHYLQGKAPAINFLDEAVVNAVDQRECVPIGCFNGVLVVDEFNPLDQPADGHQFKYHVPGIGVAQVVGVGGVEQETLALTDLRSLDAVDMAAATTRALQLDTNAYTRNKAVWTGTPKAVQRPPAP